MRPSQAVLVDDQEAAADEEKEETGGTTSVPGNPFLTGRAQDDEDFPQATPQADPMGAQDHIQGTGYRYSSVVHCWAFVTLFLVAVTVLSFVFEALDLHPLALDIGFSSMILTGVSAIVWRERLERERRKAGLESRSRA